MCDVVHKDRGRSKMDVVCMVDTNIPNNLHHRKTVLKEIINACDSVNANLHHETVFINYYLLFE